MAKKKPAPVRQKLGELAPPPHHRHGYYQDKTNKLYWVANKPDFALYRLDSNFEPVDRDSPVLTDEQEFEKQLRHETFTRINH